MSSPSRQPKQTDERKDDGQLVDTDLPEEVQDVKDSPEEETKAEEDRQDVTATAEAAHAATVIPSDSETLATDSKQNPLGISLPDESENATDTDNAESRRAIEDEATPHLAQRASAMSLDQENSAADEISTMEEKKTDLPASPPPPRRPAGNRRR